MQWNLQVVKYVFKAIIFMPLAVKEIFGLKVVA